MHSRPWLIAVVLWVSASPVSAQGRSLAVLGLASESPNDATAAALTDALRAEAESLGAYKVASGRPALSQMTMAQDCEITEGSCRKAIGSALGVEHMLYGSLGASTSGGRDAEVHLFTASSGDDVVARRTIPEGSSLAEHARALLRELRGEKLPPPAAEEEPALIAPVEEAPEEPVVEDEVEEPAEPARETASSNDWLGYSLLGVAAVSTGLTVFSWLQISDAANDKEYNNYRRAVGLMNPGADDVCAEADVGTLYMQNPATVTAARNACSKGQTFEILQYVFLGAAVASAGFGVYFLLDDEASESAARGQTLALRPAVGPESAELSLRLRY